MALKADSQISRVQLTSAGVPRVWVSARFGGRATLPASRLAKEAHPALTRLLRQQGYEGEIDEIDVEPAPVTDDSRPQEAEGGVFWGPAGPLKFTPPSSPHVPVTVVDREAERWWDVSSTAAASSRSDIADYPTRGMLYGGFGSFTRHQPTRLTLGGLLTLAPNSVEDMVLHPAQGVFQPDSAAISTHNQNYLPTQSVVWHRDGFEFPVRNLENEPTPVFARDCTPENPLRLTFENRGNEPSTIIVTVFGQMS